MRVEDQDPTSRLAAALSELHEAAGSPSPSELLIQAKAQKPAVEWPSSTVHDWLHGKSAPSGKSILVFKKLVEYLEAKARRSKSGYTPLAVGRWDNLIQEAQQYRQARQGGRPAWIDDVDRAMLTVSSDSRGPARHDKSAYPATQPALAGLIDVQVQGRLPHVSELNPYSLGASPSDYGNAFTYAQRDVYIPRRKDAELASELLSGRLVILVGPSKVGKSRTAFEAIRVHDDWKNAKLAAPQPEFMRDLGQHPGLSPPAGSLTQALIAQLVNRPGRTLLLGTLRVEQRELLLGPEQELTRELRMVLDNAITIDLRSTREDPEEQVVAVATYPELSANGEGLPEVLAGAPELLRRYRNSDAADPLMHAVIQACIDWMRCGIIRPIPERDLVDIATAMAQLSRPDLDATQNGIEKAILRARKAIAGKGRISLVKTHHLPDGSRGYEAFEYLMAIDDGQASEQLRPISDMTWRRILGRANDQDSILIGIAAVLRWQRPIAVEALRPVAEAGDLDAQAILGKTLAIESGSRWAGSSEITEAQIWLKKAAEAGNSDAQLTLGMLLVAAADPPDIAGAIAWLRLAADYGGDMFQNKLGLLLMDELDPPQLTEARAWFTKAAESGSVDAQFNLGLVASKLEIPDLISQRTWYTKAARSGQIRAQVNLAALLTQFNPPELAEACEWYTKAAEAGDVAAQINLGTLLATSLKPREIEQGRRWLTIAAEAGEADAQSNLALLFEQKLNPPDSKQARKWYTKAAEAGHVDAQINLGMLLITKLWSPAARDEAVDWWHRAYESGCGDANELVMAEWMGWISPMNHLLNKAIGDGSTMLDPPNQGDDATYQDEENS